jgi:hypothetical protein
LCPVAYHKVCKLRRVWGSSRTLSQWHTTDRHMCTRPILSSLPFHNPADPNPTNPEKGIKPRIPPTHHGAAAPAAPCGSGGRPPPPPPPPPPYHHRPHRPPPVCVYVCGWVVGSIDGRRCVRASLHTTCPNRPQKNGCVHTCCPCSCSSSEEERESSYFLLCMYGWMNERMNE